MSAEGPENRPFAVLITDFFNRGVPVDLYLPDGWYSGRPMDAQHNLTFVIERPARLIVELDERILLTFTGENLSVHRTVADVLDSKGTPAVEIRAFSQLVVDARLYGSHQTDATVYRTGVALLVSSR